MSNNNAINVQCIVYHNVDLAYLKGLIIVNGPVSPAQMTELVKQACTYGTFISCIQTAEDRWEVQVELTEDKRDAFGSAFNFHVKEGGI